MTPDQRELLARASRLKGLSTSLRRLSEEAALLARDIREDVRRARMRSGVKV
jgi:hypothetical protein